MHSPIRAFVLSCAAVVGLAAVAAQASDWPQWGRTAERNMVSPEKGLPDLQEAAAADTTDFAADGNPAVKWKVRLGTTTWGNPTVAGNRVLVGTSGPNRRGGLLKCLDAATGSLVWELFCPPREFPTPERPAEYPEHSPWDYLVNTHAQTHGWGVCSSTTVEGDRAYALSSRGEVLCLDMAGLANGNQGPLTDEARYKAGDDSQPAALTSTDADILWRFDLWTETGTRPADTFSNAALVHGDLLYISTCNGIERWPGWYGKPAAPPHPQAPNLVVLDKRTGRRVAQDAEPISAALLHGQWSPPSLGRVAGRELVFYGGGDGRCYAFEALSQLPRQPVRLRKVWSYDCNPAEYRGIGVENYSLGDKDVVHYAGEKGQAVAQEMDRHRDAQGRLLAMSEIVGSPVFHDGRVYVAIGRDPRHGPGRGALHCIDATGRGDISRSGRVWCYDQIDRSLSTPSVADGLVYCPDVAGKLHCLEADTGRLLWSFDTGNETWGSTLVADGKVYLVTHKSFHVLAAGRALRVLSTIRMGADCTPVAADGVVYVVLRGMLFALQRGVRPAAAAAPAAAPATAASSPQPPAGPAESSWPGWRGPRGDGFSPEVPRELPPPKLAWSRPMAGECLAPIAAAEGCVVAGDYDGQRDSWRCFDAADGRARWVHASPNAKQMEYGAGPRAAPWIQDGRVFVLSAWGELFCLSLADGGVAWQKHLAQDFRQKTPEWGYCTSPRVAGGKLLVSPGGDAGPVAAFDPASGALLWQGAGRGLNYASLNVARLGGVEQVLGYDERSAGGWDLASGRRLWTLKIEAAAGYVVPTPTPIGERLLLASDQESARLLAFDAGGAIQPKPAAVNEDVAPDVSTPTLWGDAILCVSAGLVLLDAAPQHPLKTLWVYDKEDCVTGICHAIVSADRALVTCEDGQVLLLAADRQACRILARHKLCDKTWVYPALAAGRLYVRDRARLYCYELPGR